MRPSTQILKIFSSSSCLSRTRQYATGRFWDALRWFADCGAPPKLLQICSHAVNNKKIPVRLGMPNAHHQPRSRPRPSPCPRKRPCRRPSSLSKRQKKNVQLCAVLCTTFTYFIDASHRSTIASNTTRMHSYTHTNIHQASNWHFKFSIKKWKTSWQCPIWRYP